jgi:hypothetical protein
LHDIGRNQHDRSGAAVGRLQQADRDAVPLCQLAHDEQAQMALL